MQKRTYIRKGWSIAQIVQGCTGAGSMSPCFSGIGKEWEGVIFAGHGGIFLDDSRFFHFQQVSLPWGWGEDQMPLKRPDLTVECYKINVINELPLLVSAGGSAPELMGTFAETEGHLLYSTGCLINPNVPARIMNGRNGYCMEREWGGIIADNRICRTCRHSSPPQVHGRWWPCLPG